MSGTREPLPPPIVAASSGIAELTVKALVLGALLSMILAAANAYIGLLVGLTVSASIPAAAASMGILRMFRRSTILENNMVQTAASAGESLVAGIIFTIPDFHREHGQPPVRPELVHRVLCDLPVRNLVVVPARRGGGQVRLTRRWAAGRRARTNNSKREAR